MGDLATPNLGLIVSPVGTDGTHWYALTVDAAGHLQIDVVTSALPAGAATSANQATMITALQLIDDLRAALASVGSDELLVKAGHTGAAWRPLTVDAAGHLQIDVLTSGLPAGAATSANQATMITALQLIDDLRAALASVGSDELLVKAGHTGAAWQPLTVDAAGHLQIDVLTSGLPAGAATQATLQNIDGHTKNQILGTSGQYLERLVDLNAAAGANALNGSVVPSSECWVVTNALAYNVNTNPSEIYIGVNDGVTNHVVRRQLAPGADTPVEWSGHVYMETGDKFKAYFGGCVLNDDIYAFFQGYKMLV